MNTAANIEPLKQFGLCPKCHQPPVLLAVNRNTWGMCRQHGLAWFVGVGLIEGAFGEEAEKNRGILADCEVIDPFHGSRFEEGTAE